MRYDTPVYFQKITPGKYDPSTGNYGDDTVEETLRYASVMNTGEDQLRLVYDGPKQGSLTIQLQNHYTAPFSQIRIGEKIYQVDSSRELRTKHTFIVSDYRDIRNDIIQFIRRILTAQKSLQATSDRDQDDIQFCIKGFILRRDSQQNF